METVENPVQINKSNIFSIENILSRPDKRKTIDEHFQVQNLHQEKIDLENFCEKIDGEEESNDAASDDGNFGVNCEWKIEKFYNVKSLMQTENEGVAKMKIENF